MRLTISSNDGTVIETIEDLEQYNLSKPIAQSALVDHVREAVARGKRIEADDE